MHSVDALACLFEHMYDAMVQWCIGNGASAQVAQCIGNGVVMANVHWRWCTSAQVAQRRVWAAVCRTLDSHGRIPHKSKGAAVRMVYEAVLLPYEQVR